MLDAIEISTKTPCGYATVSNVITHQLEDKMESFFLSETTKYLYLLFSDDHWIFDKGVSGNISVTEDADFGGYRVCAPNSFGYTFTTEAHPFAAGVLGCCYPQYKVPDKLLDDIYASDSDDFLLFPDFEASLGVNPFSSATKRVYMPALPIKTSTELLDFLVVVARSHRFYCLYWEAPVKRNDVVVDGPEHSCWVKEWYQHYEVYGADWKKVPTKRAFKIIDKATNQ